ncbi:hypothetical protein BJX61DRAFT_446845 [Aspergillus egyptiacus]|nr:hypothetical protein BJX61DRAFT_446845 [Aspergillus egyptiacus]
MSPVELSYRLLWARDAVAELEQAPETFSSWDKCMAKEYCKWPVIAGIILGGVILLTIIACIVNCMCCGIRCCTSCCGCCCPSPRPKRAKYADDPYEQQINQPPPMPQMPNSGYAGGYQGGYQAPQAPPTYRGAQVARFDTPTNPALSKMNEDSLPAMPSWDGAVTRRVEDTDPHPDSVEMEPLNRPPARTPSASRVNGGGYMGPPPARTPSASGVKGGGYMGSPPARTPSASGVNGGGYMGPPPARTPSASGVNGGGFIRPPPIRTGHNDYHPDSHGYDDPNPYDYHAQAMGHSPTSPYDQQYNQPYRDHSPGGYHAMSPPPNAYSQQPPYPIGVAVSSATDMNRPIPFRQPSPGFRQPSPILRQPSPGFRLPSPGPGLSQPPSYRAMPPPSDPSSPPPPFSAVAPIHEVSDPGRPPSLLQSGRQPAPN